MNPNGSFLKKCGRIVAFLSVPVFCVVMAFSFQSCGGTRGAPSELTEDDTRGNMPQSTTLFEDTTLPSTADEQTSADTTASVQTTSTAISTPPLETTAAPGPVIRTETEETLRAIPYETQYEYSDRYYKGDQIVRVNGVEGRERLVTVTVYEDDRIASVDSYTERLFDPSDAVVVIGTKDPYTYGTVFAKEKTVPFSTEYEYDSTRYDDERDVVSEGKDGYTEVTYRLTFERGQEISREAVSSRVVEPTPKRIRIGTKPATREVTEIKRENVVRYTTTYEYDATLEDGVRNTKISGIDGYTEAVYRVTYYHGAETGRECVESTVHAPQNEVIVIGTKKEETFGMPFIDAAHGGYNYNVTQYYGGSNSHGGIDFGVWYGSPITAVKSGKVVYAYDDGDLPKSDLRWTYGTYVVIEHADGVRTYYAHMKDRTVSVGDTVEKGEILGHSGNTGRVSPAPTPDSPLAGTHLHFEVRVWNGSTYVKTDPKAYLPYWN